MKEEIRTTIPIGVTKWIPIKGHEDSTACTQEIDWSFFIYDSNRLVYIRKPDVGFNPERDTLWVYTKEFIDIWKEDLANHIWVMRDEMKPLLLTP